VAASVISMGLISLPIMMRYGYDRRLASGVITASGTLAQIIPPSLVLIVLADQMGRSVGDMYEGALVPGLVLSGLYVAYVTLITFVAPRAAPALPPEARQVEGEDSLSIILFIILFFLATGLALAGAYYGGAFFHDRVGFGWLTLGYAPIDVAAWHILAVCVGGMVLILARSTSKRRRMLWRVLIAFVPPLLLIFLVLGTIFMGIATPTEGGAMGATGALILALLNRRLNLKLLRQAMDTTAKLSAFVMFILIGATCFSLTFNGVEGDKWVESLLTGIPGGWLGFVIVVNLLVFFLAFFLDFFELAFIIVPLLTPVAEKVLAPVVAVIMGMPAGAGVSDAQQLALIWFGIMLAVNMQTSFMHPPFGFALFYLRSVAPDKAYVDRVTGKQMPPITTGQIYWGAVPFVMIQVVMVVLLISFPQIVFLGVERQKIQDPTKIHIKLPTMPGGDEPLGPPKLR
jgi:TRAP-type mannitol/chloroaromatic compound transport system permease large subunit